MLTNLYLDTARFGLMVPAAQKAHADFAQLCGEEGGSAHVEEFLRGEPGTSISPIHLRCPGLAGWHGIADLKESLCILAGAPAGTPVLVANRSAQLMQLAAKALFRRCGSVLHTDLEWPGYRTIIDSEARRTRGRVVCFPARNACFRQGITAAQFVQSLVTSYRSEHCEGLFLSAVSFEGVRLPAAAIVAALSHHRPPRFVVVDGAQALAHLPAVLPDCDIYLAGCHKWLGAGHPMGLAFCPRPRSHDFINSATDEMLTAGNLDDPLLRFVGQLEGGCKNPFRETVRLDSLFSCGAAVAADAASPIPSTTRLEIRLANANAVADAAQPAGWETLLPESSFRSGIVLVQANSPGTRAAAPEAIRSRFQQQGVAVTTYADGLARVSLPAVPWKGKDLDQLRAAFTLCS